MFQILAKTEIYFKLKAHENHVNCDSNGNGLIIAGFVGLLGFHIWETIDVMGRAERTK